MSPSQLQNVPASIRQRLLNLARQQGEDFQFVLTRFALERLTLARTPLRLPGGLPE